MPQRGLSGSFISVAMICSFNLLMNEFYQKEENTLIKEFTIMHFNVEIGWGHLFTILGQHFPGC